MNLYFRCVPTDPLYHATSCVVNELFTVINLFPNLLRYQNVHVLIILRKMFIYSHVPTLDISMCNLWKNNCNLLVYFQILPKVNITQSHF